MILKCECGNISESEKVGKDSLDYEDGEKYHDVHDFKNFEFGFNDYNLTLVITCKNCGKIVNIGNTDGSINHIQN